MSSQFQIKKYQNSDTDIADYFQQLPQEAKQIKNEDILKIHEAYKSFKRLPGDIFAKNKIYAIETPSLNLFYLNKVPDDVQMMSCDMRDIKFLNTNESNDSQIGRPSVSKAEKTFDMTKERVASANIKRDRSNEVSINSPLWTISQNTHLKQDIERAIRESRVERSRSPVNQGAKPFQLSMKSQFKQLVLSGMLTIENGKASYKGQKLMFDIPPEWNINTITSDDTEILHPSQKNVERDALWNQIIVSAIDRSPGAMVAKLREDKRAEVLREEWLVEDPLTGICTGLALEFLLETELSGSPQSIWPSDEARYWEKLLIPVMEKVLQFYYFDDPDQLNQERHYRAVYKQMIKVIEEKAHLKASIQSLHVPLCQLGKQLQSTQGHSLVIIELPGTRVAANHTIYFNVTDRTIADNGVIIHVPQDDDYGVFVDFYMKKMEYHNRSDRFTLISVIKDPQFDTVRKPSMMDRIFLSTEMTFDYLLRQIRVPNTSLKDCDVMRFNPYSPY